jgi:hypothetical protein
MNIKNELVFIMYKQAKEIDKMIEKYLRKRGF